MNGIAEQHIGGYSGDQLFFVAYAQVCIAIAINVTHHVCIIFVMCVQYSCGVASSLVRL